MKHIQKDPSKKSIQEVFLENQGIESVREINENFIKSRNNEYKVQGAEKFYDTMSDGIKSWDAPIVVCGDYDVDGVMATTIMVLTLRNCGYTNVSYMIPDRSEGYGLNTRMIEEIAQTKGDPESITIITVDNGIVAFEAIELAKNYGMKVIVTDHHLGLKNEDGSYNLPNADLIIDPAFIEGTADFPKYCGAGLAYKIAQEIISPRYRPAGSDTTLLDQFKVCAMLATFADVVELKEENYVIAREGLTLLNKKKALDGVLALCEAADIEYVDEQTVLFKIAPIINAPGRIKPNGAMQAVELMLSDAGFDADRIAKELVEINEERKKLVEAGNKKLKSQIEGKADDIYIEYIPNTHSGIVGILAGQMAEDTKRSAIVFTDSEKPGIYVGSARSKNDLNMKQELDKMADILVAYGGHEGAAGLSIKAEDLETFRNRMQADIATLGLQFEEPDVEYYDLEIPCTEVEKAVKELERYAPFGAGNPRVSFKITDFNVDAFAGVYKRVVAKGGVSLTSKNHVKAIGFGQADKMEPYEKPSKLTLYGNLAYNRFRGKATPQIEFDDFEVIEEHKRLDLSQM